MNRFGNFNYRYNNNQIKYQRFNRQRFGKQTPSSMQYAQNYYRQPNRSYQTNPNYPARNRQRSNANIPQTVNNIKNNRNQRSSKKFEKKKKYESDSEDDGEIGVSYIVKNCPSITVVRDFFKDQAKYIEDEDDESDDLNLN